MPGIFGCINKSASKAIFPFLAENFLLESNKYRHQEQFNQDIYIDPPFLVGFHSTQKLDTLKKIVRSDSVLMAFNGILFEPWPLENLSTLLSLYRKNKAAFIESLRGNFSFSICDYDKGEIAIYTDQAGTKPVYYAIQNESFYFAGDYSTLNAILPKDGDIDPEAVYDILTFGYLLGNKTPNKAIKCMPPASCLTWNVDTKELKISSYFTIPSIKEFADYSQTSKQLEELFINAVDRSFRAGRSLFTISGGLDSRAVLAAALRLGHSRLECLSFGEPTSLDIKLALQVAQKTHSEIILTSLGNGDYLADTFSQACHFNGGMVYYSGSAHMLYALSKLDTSKWDIVQTGMSGDMLMGSFLYKSELNEPANDKILVSKRIIGRLGQMTWIDNLVADKKMAYSLVNESVINSIKEIKPGTSMSQALENWNLENRQQRGMFNGFRMIENFAEFSSPFFDTDFYKFAMGIPHQHRQGEKIYIDMLSRLLPDYLWKIPWQKTGRAPSTHNWVNKLNATITLSTGRAKQLVFPQIARQRSMNPIHSWIHDNSRLRDFAVQQLSSWDSIPYLLDKRMVSHFCQEIEQGRIGINTKLSTLLFRLLTLSTWGSLGK